MMNKPEPISPLFLESLFDWNIYSRDIFTYNWIKNAKKQLSVKEQLRYHFSSLLFEMHTVI